MRRIIRWGVGLLAAILIAAAIASLALSYGWQRAWVKERVENAASDALGRSVLIESIEGVLHREFTLSGVEVSDANEGAEADSPLVTVDQLGVRIESFTLRAEPVLTLDALRFSGVALHARQAEDGSWPWEDRREPSDAETSAESSPAFRLRARSVVLRDVRARAQPQGQLPLLVGFDADIEGVELGASTEVEKFVASFEAASEGTSEPDRIGGRMAGRYLNGEWHLAALEAESEEFNLSAKGIGNGERIREARVVVEIASLNAFAETLGASELALEGVVKLTADFSGPYAWPLETLSVEGSGLKAGENEVGDIRLKAHAKGPWRLEVDALSLDHREVGLVADAGAAISIVGGLTSVENLTIRTREGPGIIRVAATLPNASSSATGALMHDARTRLELVSSEFRLETLQPLLNLWGLAAEGQLDAELGIRGAPSGPQVSGFLALASSAFVVNTATVEGLDLKLELSGTLEKPLAFVSGSGRRLAIADQELGVFSIVAKLSENSATIDRLMLDEGPLALRVRPGSRVAWSGEQLRFDNFAVEEGNQKIVLRGAVSRDRADALEIDISSIEPARILDRLRAMGFVEEDQEIGGIVTGELLLSGTRGRPEIRGSFDWSSAQLGDFNFDSIRAKVKTEGAFVRVSTDWEREAKFVAKIQASLPRDQLLVDPEALVRNPQARMQAQLDQFELGSLSPFLPAPISSLSGKLSMALDAQGASTRPALTGHLVLEEGGLKLSALGGQAFAPIGIRAELRDGLIEVEEFRVGEGEQRVDGQATIQLDGVTPSEIDSQLTFRSFPVDAPGLVKGTLSGPLKLKGKPEALDLTGSLEIGGLLVRIPDPGDKTLKEIRIVSTDSDAPPAFKEEGAARSLLDPLRISVDVRLAKNSWARGRGAEIELRGDLNASKARGEALRLSGSVNTVRGTYEVYGRRFRIERGEVVLDGGIDADPVLDVRALHRVRRVKIYAIIEGRLSEPRLRFESDPELDETDIASYLLLGRPASGSAGEDQLALEAVAAQVAVGAAIREFERMFGGALPVDLIDIRMDDGGDEREFRAGVGKYIGDRLFLHYERGFGDEPDDELKAEYELTPIWSLESTISSYGDTAGDIVFELDY